MGLYVTQQQLASEAHLGPPGFTTNTNPNVDKANEIVTQVESEVNASVGTRYAIPLVQQVNKDIVSAIVLAIGAARVARIMAISSPTITGRSSHQDAEESAYSRLEAIRDGKLYLAGEVAAVAGNGVASHISTTGCLPVFRRERRQW